MAGGIPIEDGYRRPGSEHLGWIDARRDVYGNRVDAFFGGNAGLPTTVHSARRGEDIVLSRLAEYHVAAICDRRGGRTDRSFGVRGCVGHLSKGIAATRDKSVGSGATGSLVPDAELHRDMLADVIRACRCQLQAVAESQNRSKVVLL